MATTAINTSKLNNTYSIAADTVLTFSVQPSADKRSLASNWRIPM
jgi:hypothetical protein